MSTRPATASGLQIVGYGVEGASSFPQPMLVLAHTPAGARNPKQFIPLVRESDALAAIEALRVETSNTATIAKLSAEYIEALRAERDALLWKASVEIKCIADRDRRATDIDHTIALLVEEQTHALQVTQAELRKIIAVQLKGLQAVAMLRKRCPITRWNDLPAPYIGEFIDAAIAIDGGKPLPVAGVSP